MNKIQDLYFTWLGEKIDPEEHYSALNFYIHAWDFRWTIAIDKNRQVDGYYLRRQFLQEYEFSHRFAKEDFEDLDFLNVSVFEVLVALTLRLEHELNDLSGITRFEVWYKQLLTNLDLDGLTNSVWMCNETHAKAIVWEVITRLLDRTYDRDGVGGLFPIKNAVEDQRTIEIWYQMMMYLHFA